MKIRNGFVSNSSSSSFIITNHTDKPLTLVDFVNENPQLIEEFCNQYDWNNYSQLQLLYSAKDNDMIFNSGEAKECIFGDEQGTLIGRVFDYILRDGGQSKSFNWNLKEYLR